MSHTKNKSGPPRFQVGNKVRVKYGVIDPDFPDIPLGGWTGTVTEVEQTEDQITYEIKRDKRTLNGIHPAYCKRCERDALESKRSPNSIVTSRKSAAPLPRAVSVIFTPRITSSGLSLETGI